MSPSAGRTACRWSRRRAPARRSPPRTRSISATPPTATDARRYDMGERDHFVSLEMASIGMEMMAGWGSEPIVARLAMLTDRLADGLGQSQACACSTGSCARRTCSACSSPRAWRRICRRSSRRRMSMPHRGSAASDQPARLQRRAGRRPLRRGVPQGRHVARPTGGASRPAARPSCCCRPSWYSIGAPASSSGAAPSRQATLTA